MSSQANNKGGLPTGSGHHASRLLARQDVLIGVKLRRKGESWFTSRVVDISQEGFCLSTFVHLEEGMRVWIMFPGFDGRPAIVRRVGNHQAGCTFEKPLHPAILDYIVRMSDPEARG